MSTSLSWRPVKAPSNNNLNTVTKFVLRKRYGEPINVALTSEDAPYLAGIRDGATDPLLITDIDKLLGAIEQHFTIHLAEEWL